MTVRDQNQPYSRDNRPEERWANFSLSLTFGKQTITNRHYRWIGFLPLYHAFGQIFTNLMAPKLGVKLYVMKKFEFAAFLGAIERYKITHLQVAPPIMVMLSRRPEAKDFDLSSLVNILCGAAPLKRELQNEVSQRFDVSVIQGWGMTETTLAGIQVPSGLRDDTGSAGLLDPETEAKLVDDNGNIVPRGRPGELVVRGPQICMGYWRNEKATKETLSEDGWLKTGDVAVADHRNWLYIVDRKKASL